MQKNIKFRLFCFFLLLIVTFPAAASDIELAKKSTIESILKSGQLRVGLEPGYLPFEMTTKKGILIGFDVDIATALARSMGVKLIVINTPWDGIIPALVTDKFDVIISGMVLTQQRHLSVNFTDPYITIGQAVLLNQKHQHTVTSYMDLNNSRFVLVSRLGTTGEQAIKRMIPKARYKAFENESEAAMEVVYGRADALIYDLPFIERIQADHGQAKTVALTQPFTYEPIAMAVRKGDPDFISFLNHFIRQYKNDGRYERSYNKWFRSSAWMKEIQ